MTAATLPVARPKPHVCAFPPTYFYTIDSNTCMRCGCGALYALVFRPISETNSRTQHWLRVRWWHFLILNPTQLRLLWRLANKKEQNDGS